MEGTAVDADIILQHKENIQPMASGRRVAALATTLSSTTPKGKEDPRMAERARLRYEAEHALEEEDDPLAAWVTLVDWTVDNYPQGATVESGLLELLELVTRTFAHDDAYKKDMRYLKLWVHYATLVDHPTKIFAYLYTNEIGTSSALFYEEYCNALEKLGRRTDTLEMYDVGIARKARPTARLEARKRDFSKRMLVAGPAAEEEVEQARTGLAERLKTHHTGPLGLRNDLPYSVPSSGPAARPGNNKGAFQVFSDGIEERPSNSPWEDLESRDSHRKENTQAAVPAEGQTLKQKIVVPSTPRVAVFVDNEEQNAPKTPARKNLDDVFSRSAKKAGIETLKRDPLRNFQNPTELPPVAPLKFPSVASDPFSAPAPSTAQAGDTKRTSSKKGPKGLPPVKPNERLQMSEAVIWHAEIGEIHPWEHRARYMGLAGKKWPTPTPEQLVPLAQQDHSSQNPHANPHHDGHARVNFEGTRTFAKSGMLTGEATVTINTKAALMDVYGMYNSPTKSMKLGDAVPTPKMMRPEEIVVDGVPPTPTPGIKRDENAMSEKRVGFLPFSEADSETPAPKRVGFGLQTPGSMFQTPSNANKTPGTIKRGLSVKATPSLPSTREEIGPLETPLSRKATSIVPFNEDSDLFSSRNSASRTQSQLNALDEEEVEEEREQMPVASLQPDVFFTGPSPKLQVYEDHGEEESDGERSFEQAPPTTPFEIYEEDQEVYEEEDTIDEGAEEQDYAGRWAPALTPITERTYEFTNMTGMSRNGSTPQDARDRSIQEYEDATGVFGQAEAALAAERLAQELQEADHPDDDASPPAPVDPYTTASKAHIIPQLPVPPSHRDLRPLVSGHLDRLQRFVKQQVRRGSKDSANSSLRRSGGSNGEDSYSLELDGQVFEVTAKLGEGGFGAVFLARDVARADQGASEEECQVAVKVLKPAAVWESHILERIRACVDEAFHPSIIEPHNLYIFKDETFHILEYSHHGTLLEAVNKANDLHIGSDSKGSIPGLDEMLAMFFTVELLKTVGALHEEGFIHGDLKIDNCMVRVDSAGNWNDLSPQYEPFGGGGWSSNGVKLIDFGRSIDTRLWPAGQQYIMSGDWKIDKRDCLEIRKGESWTYETDYYGLAGIIFCLLFGKYMEMPLIREAEDGSGEQVQKVPATLKRYWNLELWEPLFDVLLNPRRHGRVLPVTEELVEIREKMEEWLVENSNKASRRANLKTLIRRLSALSLS